MTNNTLLEKIRGEYPELLGQHLDIHVGKGWHPLVLAACRIMYSEYENAQKNVKYSKPEDLALEKRRLANAKHRLGKIQQIKEKFGGLRMYCDGGGDAGYAATRMAEHLSYEVCEECGAQEQVRTWTCGWNLTLCTACARKIYDDYKVDQQLTIKDVPL